MKANELMVGDWVKETFKVIDGKTIKNYKQVISISIGGYDNDLRPIPITVELLEKLGFKKTVDIYNDDIDTNVWLNKEGRIEVNKFSNSNDRNWSCHIDNEDSDTIASCDIEYLHQLQQIVRIATGKEMEIKL